MKFCFGRKLIKSDSRPSFPERDPERRFNYSSPFTILFSTHSYTSVIKLVIYASCLIIVRIKLRRKYIESIIFLHDSK